ncbi:hypothetical protein Tco_1127051 [Tanacetum coccineum]
MEEYVRLEEEKAHRRDKVYNWETATYGKIWYDEDVHDLISVETEFPVIAFINTLIPEPTVGSLNNKIDFRISFDESGDEYYMVIYDKNSFCYKIIFVNNLKTENDNENVNMPSFPPPEVMVSCSDDLDFFKDFENEFPAIVYNNAQTSKSYLLTELILSPQHIDEFDLKDDTSLSEYCLYGLSKPHGYGILTFWKLSSLFFSTVDTAYSLNEYSVFDTGPRERKSTNVGGVFTNLEILKC